MCLFHKWTNIYPSNEEMNIYNEKHTEYKYRSYVGIEDTDRVCIKCGKIDDRLQRIIKAIKILRNIKTEIPHSLSLVK